MSAHICEQITYDRIGSFINIYFFKHFRSELEKHYGDGLSQQASVNQLINDMYQENIRSVNCRYREKHSFPPIQFNRIEVDVIQFMKSIAYWKYQSCETPDWETSKIYQLATQLRVSSIELLSGYEDAEWG
jgi:hypothetical protein